MGDAATAILYFLGWVAFIYFFVANIVNLTRALISFLRKKLAKRKGV
jgi:hypothetical protein